MPTPAQPAWETEFIALWQQDASYRELAAALGCPLGTVASRSAALVAQGKITPRQRGGAYPRRHAQAQQGNPPAPTRDPPRSPPATPPRSPWWRCQSVGKSSVASAY
jgi:hypothetical protein